MRYLHMAWHTPGTIVDLYRIFREMHPRWQSLRYAVACEFYAWRRCLEGEQ